jgi:putative transposase
MNKKSLHAKCRKCSETTKSSGIQAIAGNFIEHQFCPICSDLAWSGDITTIDATDGGRYFADGLDLNSRRIIGRSLQNSLNSSSVTQALDCVFGSRFITLDELMIDADRGRKDKGKEYQQHLVGREIRAACTGKEIAEIMLLRKLLINAKG